MSVTVKQVGINVYLVNGEKVSKLSTALSIAKETARELSDLTGLAYSVVQEVWC